MLTNKHILLGITGGIAAYKSADLARRLRELGAEVRIVMTNAAKEFITPLTMQAVSGNPVHQDLLDPTAEAAMGHIELARWADLILIAPTTANFIAKLTYGLADDLLSTLCLATTAPIILVPAMNQQMWLNPATQDNIKILQQRGIQLLGPAEGLQACGEFGPGRMLEPLEIAEEISYLFAPTRLKNKKVIITAGPTRENIDPVRYISNRSSGKMGFALAEAAVAAGAEVILISGPVNIPTPKSVERVDIKTAQQMHDVVMSKVKQCDIFIAAAAVADYRCENPLQQKIKKSDNTLTLTLEKNADILADVAKLKTRPSLVVGFAAETQDVVKNAELKLKNKNLDVVIANQVGDNIGFESDDNAVIVISKGAQTEIPLMPKKQLARKLVKLIADQYQE